MPQTVVPKGWKALGYQQITNVQANAHVHFTVPAGAQCALVVCETQAIRWRDDGTDPTSSVGMPLAVATELFYRGELDKISMIAQVNGAVINIAYYR